MHSVICRPEVPVWVGANLVLAETQVGYVYEVLEVTVLPVQFQSFFDRAGPVQP